MPYHRNRFTWTAFGALLAFGYLNAVLGPSLPYIRSAEGISYLLGSAHQVGIARDAAVALVSVLYAANLAGRLLASRMARSQPPERVLVLAMAVVSCGLPFLLAATNAVTAVVGIVLVGAGIAALFPLTSSLHVQATGGTADSALGEILSVAAIGQMGGPLLAGAIAQAANLRLGLIVLLPTLLLLAAVGLAAHHGRIGLA